LKMRPLHGLKTLGNKHSVTEVNIPEERGSQLNRVESLKTWQYW
jgi:hypothetical protein